MNTAEAREFLISKAQREAILSGSPLSDEDQLVLRYSVDEPRSAAGIRSERLEAFEPEFEQRVTNLLLAAFDKDKECERATYKEALLELSRGDHFLSVIALPLSEVINTRRSFGLYVAIGVGIVILVVALAILK